MARKLLPLLVALLVLTVFAPGARALINVQSDGTDGALNVAVNDTLDLSLATTGVWNDPAIGSTNGIYDADQWAVVYHFTSVNIVSGKTLYFKNHPSGAPVVWLVSGNVTIAGTLALNGQDGQLNGTVSEPGPGGFRGGRGLVSTSTGSAGFGPGGGTYPSGSAGYSATAGGIVYGNARILPLVGGSGGGGVSTYGQGGGAGGGAILIAAAGSITVSGTVTATGGSWAYDGGGNYSGSGSGGGIRFIADAVATNASSAVLGANGGPGTASVGRIRIEANTINLSQGSISPNASVMLGIENNEAVLWPLSTSPSVQVTTLAGLPVPADPSADFIPPGDLLVIATDSVDVEIVAKNVPTDLARRWNVKLRVVLRSGVQYLRAASYDSGDSTQSLWTTKLPPLPDADFVAIQARVSKPGY